MTQTDIIAIISIVLSSVIGFCSLIVTIYVMVIANKIKAGNDEIKKENKYSFNEIKEKLTEVVADGMKKFQDHAKTKNDEKNTPESSVGTEYKQENRT